MENGLDKAGTHILDLVLFSLLAPGYFAFVGDLIEGLYQSYKERSLKIKFRGFKEYAGITRKLAPFYFLYDSTVGLAVEFGINVVKNMSSLPTYIESIVFRYLNYFIFFSTVNQLYAKYERVKERFSSLVTNFVKNSINKLKTYFLHTGRS
jgi:hypothetical protein